MLRPRRHLSVVRGRVYSDAVRAGDADVAATREVRMEFVVVSRVRARLGSSSEPANDEEDSAPYVGRSKAWQFDCPRVDTNAEALLMFQLLGNAAGGDRLRINGVEIAGGVPRGGYATISTDRGPLGFGLWSAQLLIVPPEVLVEVGNELVVEARSVDGGTTKTGNFVIDNIVVQYATSSGKVGPLAAE